MHQGKSNIIMDPYTRKNIALRFHLNPRHTFNHNFIPLPVEASKRITTDQFEAKIKDRVQHGWDGKAIPGTSLDKLSVSTDPAAGNQMIALLISLNSAFAWTIPSICAS